MPARTLRESPPREGPTRWRRRPAGRRPKPPGACRRAAHGSPVPPGAAKNGAASAARERPRGDAEAILALSAMILWAPSLPRLGKEILRMPRQSGNPALAQGVCTSPLVPVRTQSRSSCSTGSGERSYEGMVMDDIRTVSDGGKGIRSQTRVQIHKQFCAYEMILTTQNARRPCSIRPF